MQTAINRCSKLFSDGLIDFHKHNKGCFFCFTVHPGMISWLFGLWKTDGFILPLEINGWLHCETPGALEVAKDVEFVAWSELYLACREYKNTWELIGFSRGFPVLTPFTQQVEVGGEYPLLFNRVSKTSQVVLWDFRTVKSMINVKRYDFPDIFCRHIQPIATCTDFRAWYIFLKPGLPSPWLIPW